MIRIREMEAGDVDAAALLEQQIFSRPWSRQGFLDALEMDNTIFLVAEERGTVTGYAGLYGALDEGEITNVAVDGKRRCRGTGALLIRGLKELAEQRGIKRLILEVRVSNDAAIRLYERNGFTKQGIRRDFYELPREDAYIMLCGQ